jgi:hypothetical protein
MPGKANSPLARHSPRQRSGSFGLNWYFRAISPVAEPVSRARMAAIFRSRL